MLLASIFALLRRQRSSSSIFLFSRRCFLKSQKRREERNIWPTAIIVVLGPSSRTSTTDSTAVMRPYTSRLGSASKPSHRAAFAARLYQRKVRGVSCRSQLDGICLCFVVIHGSSVILVHRSTGSVCSERETSPVKFACSPLTRNKTKRRHAKTIDLGEPQFAVMENELCKLRGERLAARGFCDLDTKRHLRK